MHACAKHMIHNHINHNYYAMNTIIEFIVRSSHPIDVDVYVSIKTRQPHIDILYGRIQIVCHLYNISDDTIKTTSQAFTAHSIHPHCLDFVGLKVHLNAHILLSRSNTRTRILDIYNNILTL
eukprot:455729_1